MLMPIKDFLFSKKYGSLRSRVSYFFYAKIPFISKGWNDYHNPWYHWWKARKYFKRPKAHLIKGEKIWFFGLPCRRDYYNRLLDIRFSALGWKDKYNSPRHEWDPYIAITFLRKYHIIWVFNWVVKEDKDSHTSSLATWEAILDYLYYKTPIDRVLYSHIWASGIGENSYNITIKRNMK